MTNANDLNNATNYLRATVASLNSAKAWEVANETRLVVDAINAVKSLQDCRSKAAVDRAINMIGNAMDMIRSKGERS